MIDKTKIKKLKCPNCGKPVDEKYHPFCSKRCADVDLGKWLSDGYVIETEEIPSSDETYH